MEGVSENVLQGNTLTIPQIHAKIADQIVFDAMMESHVLFAQLTPQ